MFFVGANRSEICATNVEALKRASGAQRRAKSADVRFERIVAKREERDRARRQHFDERRRARDTIGGRAANAVQIEAKIGELRV